MKKAAVMMSTDSHPTFFAAFLFWTSVTGLHAEIFYFSVYNMGVGGHEALLVIQVIALSVSLLPPFQRLLVGEETSKKLTKKTGDILNVHIGRHRLSVMVVVYLLCLSGFASWIFDDALTRLISTALSCSGFTYLTTLEWGRAWETNEMDYKALVWIVGLLLSSLAKYANHSNNPAWNFLKSDNGGLNAIALILAICAITQRLISLQRQYKSRLEPYKPRKRISGIDSTIAILSLGALIFGFHVLLSDSGTLIAWTWTGYPVKGPMAIPHGRLILLASCVASIISINRPSLALQPLFWIFGSISLFVIWAYEDWIGFIGAIGVAIFLPVIASPLLQNTMQNHPFKIMLGAWFVADLLAFFQVLTAAYAFVPGGKVMREHTGLMMAIMMTFLSLGLWKSRCSESQIKTTSKRTRMLGTVALSILALISQLVPLFRAVDPQSIKPHHPSDRVFTAGIWTIHFGLDQSMWESSRRIAELVEDMQLDVIGLLESDTHRTVFGNRDLTQYLAERLNMYADIGPGPDKHTWGAAMLSKFPIINSTHHLLPSPNGELAPAIHAVLDVYGVHTHVIVSHNGQEEDPYDRELQTTEIARILSEAYPHPAVFLGYVVTKPHASRPNPYEILFKDGRIFDVHPDDPDRWCQYIGFRALERVAYVRVSRYTVTDTELQTAKFRVQAKGMPSIDPDKDVLPFHTMVAPIEGTEWAYPTKFIDPPAMVYDRHKYSPWYWPWYYHAQEAPQLVL